MKIYLAGEVFEWLKSYLRESQEAGPLEIV